MGRTVLLLTALIALPDRAAERLNIIVVADHLGYGDLGCHGHPPIKTSNLDAFARRRPPDVVLRGEYRDRRF